MRIFLVNPFCLDPRVDAEDAESVPMGLYYIGAFLKENHLDVRITNLAGRQNPMNYLGRLLAEEKPGMIGVSVLSATRFSALEVIETAKRVDPSVTTVFGGPGATSLVDYFFKIAPELDYIVPGEGEETLLELALYLADGNKEKPAHIPGLVYRDDQTVVRTGMRPLIPDLDILPHPGKYFDLQHLALSRGCPGQCRFCGSPDFWGRAKVRFHSPGWFVDHLELLVKRGITHFFVSDDTFTMDKKRVKALCREIIKRGLVITWAAISRVDFLDETILFWMRRAGCIQLSFGVESGSPTIRKTLGKPVKRQRIVKAFKMTASHGILARAYFIYGSPGESEASIRQSIDLMLELKPFSVIFYILVLFPGTDLYRELEEKGLVSDDIWQKKMEDIPWFQLDPDLDFETVKGYGQKLRQNFYGSLHRFADQIQLEDNRELYECHADFLSRLAMTFSHGEYARNPAVIDSDGVAKNLYRRSLAYHPDPRAYLGLAMLFQKEKNFKEAVKLLTKALGLFPDIKNLTVCMAVSLMNLGRFSEALRFLEKHGTDQDTAPYIKACRDRGGR